jgi:hypothetical protein
MLYFSYYLLCFLFKKIREQEGGTGSSQKGGRGQLIYTPISKCKNDKIKNKKVRISARFCKLNIYVQLELSSKNRTFQKSLPFDLPSPSEE